MEPWNTVSSLIYVAAAAAILGLGMRREYRAQKYAFAWAVALTGVTSAWFHADLRYYQQKLDESFETLAVILLLHWAGELMASKSPRDGWSVVTTSIVHWVLILPFVWLVKELVCELHLIACALLAAHRLHLVVQRHGDS